MAIRSSPWRWGTHRCLCLLLSACPLPLPGSPRVHAGAEMTCTALGRAGPGGAGNAVWGARRQRCGTLSSQTLSSKFISLLEENLSGEQSSFIFDRFPTIFVFDLFFILLKSEHFLTHKPLILASIFQDKQRRLLANPLKRGIFLSETAYFIFQTLFKQIIHTS